MADAAPERHVFVSYVHENSKQVDELCAVLEALKIPYWRDRSKLGPGEEWKAEIRKAIRSGSMAFLACFSDESRAKEKSHMNEELTLATEEWRLRPPGRTWLIPVRFDGGAVPEWDLGAGKTLNDLNYCDLFGEGYTPNVAQLVETIKEVMGLTPSLDSATVQAAVAESTAEHRPALLRQLTKEMIRDQSKDVDLDDLVTAEVARVRAAVRDTDRFPTSSGGGNNSELAVSGAKTATDYWTLVEPFCWSLQVAARYGSRDSLTPWVNGMKGFAAEANKIAGGHTYLLSMRHIPVLATVFVATMASSGQGKWTNLKALVVDAKVADRYNSATRSSLAEAVSPYKPFDSDHISQLLINAAVLGLDFEAAQAAMDERKGMNYYTPGPDWLHRILRPVFDQQFPDDEEYDAAFDATEVFLGVVEEDLINVRLGTQEERSPFAGTKWLGRSAWRARHRDSSPVQQLREDLAENGSDWGPLGAGLFGSSVDRATAAIGQYEAAFNEYRSQSRFF